MIRKLLSICLFISTASVLRAQTAEVVDEIDKGLQSIRQTQRTEDIEVMRRILNQSLRLVDQSARAETGTSITATGPGSIKLTDEKMTLTASRIEFFDQLGSGKSGAIPPFDGIYLNGHGVVYTLKIPASVGLTIDPLTKNIGLLDTCLKCHVPGTIDKASVDSGKIQNAAPKTEWDRTVELLRRERGLAPPTREELTSTPVCEPGKMSEIIIAKLFQNARNIRHLGDNEQVTVVITFEGISGSARDRFALGGPPKPGGLYATLGFNSEETKTLMLGDLHLKQGQPKEAIEHYRSGIARFLHPNYKLSIPPRLSAAQSAEMILEFQKGMRSIFASMAEAYKQSGDLVKAQEFLDKAKNYRATVIDSNPETLAVPAKLIIATTKKQLELNDLIAFRKEINVETVGIALPKKSK